LGTAQCAQQQNEKKTIHDYSIGLEAPGMILAVRGLDMLHRFTYQRMIIAPTAGN
jgi:hypothetical protein